MIPARNALLLVTACVLGGCSEPALEPDEPAAAKTVEIVATAPTVAWLARELVSSAATVTLVEPATTDAALSEEQLLRLAQADLVIVHGAGLDAWTEVVELPTARTIDASADARVLEREGARHSHGDEGEHSHAEPLPGTWHDPSELEASLELVASALDGLTVLSPPAVEHFRERLSSIGARLERATAALAGRPLTADDELGYLQRALEERRDGEAPETSGEPYHLSSAPGEAESATVVLEPLLPPPDDGDYLSRAERNLDLVVRGLES